MSIFKKIIKSLWFYFICFILSIPLYIFFVNKNLFGLFGTLPSIEDLENPKDDISSEVYSADGVLLGKYYRYNRSPVDYDDISKNIISALISTEDLRFYDHNGLDLKGIMRAIIMSVILRKNKGGGSTITQQLAKNLFKLRTKKSLGVLEKIPIIKMIVFKTKEFIVAVNLEKTYTKREILALYLNTSSFGQNAFGIKVASRIFFNKLPRDLSINEAALLVGLLKAPTYYSPVRNPQKSILRRNLVLKNMLEANFISEKIYKSCIEKPIELKMTKEDHTTGYATYFRTVMRNFLLNWCKKNGYDLFEDGLRIYTTIDSRMQKYAENAVATHMKKLQEKFDKHWEGENPWRNEDGTEIKDFIKKTIKRTDLYRELKEKFDGDEEKINEYLNTPRKVNLFSWERSFEAIMTPLEELAYNKKFLHASFISLDSETGHIKAWVGGIDYDHFQFDNIKQNARQSGSVFKTIVFAAALENGYMPWDKIPDYPVTFNTYDENGSWTPQNWTQNFTGEKMTLRAALAKSVNSIIAALTKELTPEIIIDYAKKMGIKTYIPPVPAICLGAADMSVFEMAGAYSVFANKGIWIEPHFITKIEDKNGKCLEVFEPKKHEAISEESAYMMIYMLRGTVEEPGGLYRRLASDLKEDNQVACKTGTSQNQSDGCFVAITKGLCTAMWAGAEDRSIHFRDLLNGSGAATARPMWEIFMRQVYEDESLEYKKGPILNSKIPEKLKKYEKFFEETPQEKAA